MNYEKLEKKLKKTLTEQKDFDRALVKIGMFSPELESAFEYFIENDELPEFFVGDWNLEKIMEKIGCNEVQAFFNMDILMKNDEFRENFQYMQFGRK